MIESSFQEAFSDEWVDTHLQNPQHDLIILRQIIPWQRIIDRLSAFLTLLMVWTPVSILVSPDDANRTLQSEPNNMVAIKIVPLQPITTIL